MRIAVLVGALLLAGCATNQMPKHVMKPQPVVQAVPTKPATFKERFQKFRGKLKWTHTK